MADEFNRGPKTLPSAEEVKVMSGYIARDEYDLAEAYMGETRCPDGCVVEPDGYCSHGYKSLGLRMGLI